LEETVQDIVYVSIIVKNIDLPIPVWTLCLASEYAVVFCALVNGIERCKTEGIVDVFEAVKTPQ